MRRFASGLLLLGFYAASVHAGGTQLFFDRPTFLNRTGASIASDPYAVVNGPPEPFESGEVAFQAGGSSSLFFGEWPADFPGDNDVELALNDFENLDIMSLSGPVYAMGIEFDDASGGNAPSQFTVRALDENDVAVATFAFNTPDEPIESFIGIWSPIPFVKLEIREASDANENEYFGAVFTSLDPAPDSESPFFEESFSSGLPPGWSTQDPSGNGALWTWCDDPTAGQTEFCHRIWDDALNNQTPFAAATAETGFMTMDSDRVGNIPSNHIAQLDSGQLSVTARPQVWLRFASQIGVFTVSASDGARLLASPNGVDWTTYFAHPNLQTGSPLPPTVRWSYNPEVVVLDISDAVATSSTIFLRWEWEGSFEFHWNIDDVQLLPAPPAVFDSSPIRPSGLINVGETQLGAAASTPLTVSELGAADLTVANPEITGADAEVFSVAAPKGFPFTIGDGGAAVELSIQCLPLQSQQTYEAMLMMETSDTYQDVVGYQLACALSDLIFDGDFEAPPEP